MEENTNSNNTMSKLLIIILIITNVCTLFYFTRERKMYEIEETDGDIDLAEEADDYYKESYGNIPENLKYTSTSKTYNYVQNTYENDDYAEFEAEKLNKKIEEFNTKQKSNIVIDAVYADPDNKLAFTYEITNNNSEPVGGFKVVTVYYNESNEIINIDYVFIDYIGANSHIYQSGEIKSFPYSEYKTSIVKTDGNELFANQNNIEFEAIEDDTELANYCVYVKNNSAQPTNAMFRAIYKDKDGKVIHAEREYVYLDGKTDGKESKQMISDDESDEDYEYDYEPVYESYVLFEKDLFNPESYESTPVPYETVEVDFESTYSYDE